jgi:hypothetical protein
VDPVLIHIGYPKTATSWLRPRFFGNPDTGYLWLSNSKGQPVHRIVRDRPLEFDGADVRREFEPLLREADQANLLPVVSLERLSGHAFSGGFDSKQIADRLREVFPEARILAVVREQRSMILSTYTQYVREGGTLPLKHFIKPRSTKSMRVPSFDLRHFQYHHLLSYYRRLFGPERVLALTYEQFVRDPADFVSKVARFAGRPVESDVLASLPFDTRSNPSPSAAAIELRRRLNWLGFEGELNPDPPFRGARVARAVRQLSDWVERSGVLPRAVGAQRDEAHHRIISRRVRDVYVESKDKSLNYFTEFFEPAPEILGVPMFYAPSPEVERFEASAKDERLALTPREVQRLLADPASAPRYLVASGTLAFKTSPGYDPVSHSAFLQDFYRSISLRAELARQLEDWYDENLHGHFVVGLCVSTLNLNKPIQPGKRGRRVNDRIFKNEDRFLHKIAKACEQAVRGLPEPLSRGYKIFFTTDSPEMSELLSRLPRAVTRRKVFPPQGAGRRFTDYESLGYTDRAAAADAIIDMLLLGRCDALVKNRTNYTYYALSVTRYFSGNVRDFEALYPSIRLRRAMWRARGLLKGRDH